MTEQADKSGEIVFTKEDHDLTQEFLDKKAPRFMRLFTETISRFPNFKSALINDFFGNKLTNAVSFEIWAGRMYTVEVSENKLVVTKKQKGDTREGAFERSTITVGDLGNHILFEKTKDGKDIDVFSDTEQGLENVLAMRVPLMEGMEVAIQSRISPDDFPKHGRVGRPHYSAPNPTNQ